VRTGTLHETLATSGVYDFLKTLDRASVTAWSEDDLLKVMTSNGVDQPVYTLHELRAAGMLQYLGDGLSLSSVGMRSLILLDALNSGDVHLAYRRLRNLDNTLGAYELVQEGMTESFFENIHGRPNFARLFICSPWINLSSRNRNLLLNAIHTAESLGNSPEIFVLTRPADDGNAPAGVRVFRELGATMFLNARLHTKLYIREPGLQGGQAMAIVGSENLTRSRYLELGIRIRSDTAMVNEMIAYFWRLCNASTELGG